MKVLVVEDDETIRDYIVGCVKQIEPSNEVDAVGNGDDALTLYVQRGPYDLVITDQGHPGLPGLELIAAISARNATQRFILQSGSFRERIEAFHHQWKDIPVLEKPYRLHQLQELVKSIRSS